MLTSVCQLAKLNFFKSAKVVKQMGDAILPNHSVRLAHHQATCHAMDQRGVLKKTKQLGNFHVKQGIYFKTGKKWPKNVSTAYIFDR